MVERTRRERNGWHRSLRKHIGWHGRLEFEKEGPSTTRRTGASLRMTEILERRAITLRLQPLQHIQREAEAEGGGASFEVRGGLGGPGGAGDIEVDEGDFLRP